ncbi:MAG TPA: hypothetical protein VK727_05870 [Steroidobacteraceae bacterium]|jgi:hypothetical protein|nr:hypothetical protein [Steroidobacteraceae bacterium]
MLNRVKQITSFAILLGAAALIGCATQIPTTAQWGISKGFQRVDLKGSEYYCRLEPTSSNSSNVNCLTYLQLRNLRIDTEEAMVARSYPLNYNSPQ